MLKILTVEDDVDDIYILQKSLDGFNQGEFDVYHAGSLHDACHLLSSAINFDVILLDLNLPDSNGLDTIRSLVKVSGETPVIVLTSVDSDHIGQESIKLGAEDYIVKEQIDYALISRSIQFAIERHQLLLQIKRQAEVDGLTQLSNRSTLYRKLETLIDQAERSGMALALALFDIDDFKQINDQYGHLAGDDLLRQVGTNINTHTRKSDMACRYGGDEFILIFTNFTDLSHLAKKKHREVTGTYIINTNNERTQLNIGISMGIAIWRKSMSIGDLITAADEAMYCSKRQGKNQVTFAHHAYIGSSMVNENRP